MNASNHISSVTIFTGSTYFGLSNRSTETKSTSRHNLRKLIGTTKKTFPNSEIFFPLVNFSPNLPQREIENLKKLNHLEKKWSAPSHGHSVSRLSIFWNYIWSSSLDKVNCQQYTEALASSFKLSEHEGCTIINWYYLNLIGHIFCNLHRHLLWSIMLETSAFPVIYCIVFVHIIHSHK